MALQPYQTSLGYCQLSSTTLASAVGLANGYSTLATVAVGNSGGTNYAIGDAVTIGGTGTQAIIYVTNVSAGGVVTGVSLYYSSANPVSGMYVTGATPGTTNVTTSNVVVANAAATGLTLNCTYTASGVPLGVQGAILQALTQNVVFRDDGVAPTATTGMVVETGALSWDYYGSAANVSVIRATTGAVLNVYFYSVVGNAQIGR